MIDWSIKGKGLMNCNCNYGCPCQFSVLPTDGICEAVNVYNIEKGHFGDVKLDGLRVAGVYKWPSAIHEGNGQMQIIIDERADEDQRGALETIMTGGETDEMATMWYVYSSMCSTKHETLYAPITIEMNESDRTGIAKVEGVFNLSVTPIPNIVSGNPHKIGIKLDQGFEFYEAELGSGTTITTGGEIELLRNNATHAHFSNLHTNGNGIVK